MSTVSCPKCHDQVTVPSSAPRSARVRCPLCQEEYDLSDALAQLPPALIVVSAAPAEEPALAAVGAMDTATGSQIGSALDGDFDRPLEGGAGVFSAAVLEDAPDQRTAVTTPTPSFRSTPRPKRKEKSMVMEVVKIVLGGAVGLGLAILILWWGFGRDVGVASTVAKVSWLRWVVPPKILERVDKANPSGEQNPPELAPVNGDKKEQTSSSMKPGKLGSDPRFDEALKSSGSGQGAGSFGTPDNSQPAKTAKAEEKDPFDISDPLAPATKSGESGGLTIDGPFSTEPKETPKKSLPAKTDESKTKHSEEPTADDPFAVPVEKGTKTAKGTKPVEPAEGKPAEEKPVKKPAEKKPTEESSGEESTAEKTVEKPAEKPAAADTLAASIDAASTATKAFDSTDSSDKDARKAAAVALYNAYANLGQTVEKANLEDAENAEKLPAIKAALLEAANEPVKLNSIGALAARKLDSEEGEPGILLAGTVKDFRSAGSYFETTLELIRDKRLVTVVSSKNPQDRYKVADQVLILGSIVRDPKEKLEGYQGEAALIVKCGHAVALPAEEKPEPIEE